MSTAKMQIVREGDDYQPQSISSWRLRELLQHERDNADLRAELARLQKLLTEAHAGQRDTAVER